MIRIKLDQNIIPNLVIMYAMCSSMENARKLFDNISIRIFSYEMQRLNAMWQVVFMRTPLAILPNVWNEGRGTRIQGLQIVVKMHLLRNLADKQQRNHRKLLLRLSFLLIIL